MTLTPPIGLNSAVLCKITWIEGLQKQFAFLGGVQRGSGDKEGPDSERERRRNQNSNKKQDRETEIQRLTDRKAKKE